MVTVVGFVAAAAMGASARLLLREGLVATPIPWGTLAANLAGSFLLGVIAGWSAPAATVAGTAGLGALTTFSTFAGEVVDGWNRSRLAAAAYVGISVVGGVALAWAGLQLST